MAVPAVAAVARTATRQVVKQVGKQVSKRGPAVSRIAKDQLKDALKDFAKDSLVGKSRNGTGGLSGIARNGLRNAANSVQATVKVDTSSYDKAIQEYARVSRKDFREIVNQKAFWIALNAIQLTYRADKTRIKEYFNKPSERIPGLTVAETMVVLRRQKEGKPKASPAELKKEARKITNIAMSRTSFLRSGWIPAINIFAPLVKKTTTKSQANIAKGKPKGSGTPCPDKPLGAVYVASILNAIEAEGDAKANEYMRKGLQAAFNKEASSMMAYVEKKNQQRAANFNRR
jgi:hypothetical protein